MERRESGIDSRRERSGGFSIWHVVGSIALVSLAALVIVSLPDISRYIKISRM
ncbi:MAG: DUF6893 family small protein [Blastocatellia bacterium]